MLNRMQLQSRRPLLKPLRSNNRNTKRSKLPRKPSVRKKKLRRKSVKPKNLPTHQLISRKLSLTINPRWTSRSPYQRQKWKLRMLSGKRNLLLKRKSFPPRKLNGKKRKLKRRLSKPS